MGCHPSHHVLGSIQPETRFHEKYEVFKRLGEGSFGQVRLVVSRDGERLAVKVLHNFSCGDRSAADSKSTRKSFHAESALWQKVSGHENVVRIHEAFGTGDTHYIVMEVCRGSVLDQLSTQVTTCTTASWSLQEDLSRVFREMALGLAYCHEAGVVHRDVKPDNFLFGGESGRQVKLTDFGLSVEMPRDRLLHTSNGTAPYMSPEMLSETGYDERTDVWSFGVTIYVMLFGTFPYMPMVWSSRHMKSLIQWGQPSPTFKPEFSDINKPPELAVDFVKTLLNRHAQERCSMRVALSHTFVDTASPPTKPCVVRGGDGKAVALARAITREFEGAGDPTVHLRVDKILQRMQTKRQTYSAWPSVGPGSQRLSWTLDADREVLRPLMDEQSDEALKSHSVDQAIHTTEGSPRHSVDQATHTTEGSTRHSVDQATHTTEGSPRSSDSCTTSDDEDDDAWETPTEAGPSSLVGAGHGAGWPPATSPR